MCRRSASRTPGASACWIRRSSCYRSVKLAVFLSATVMVLQSTPNGLIAQYSHFAVRSARRPLWPTFLGGVEAEQIPQTIFIPAPDHCFRHVMPAEPHSLGHPVHRKVRAAQPEKQHVHMIAAVS